MTCYFQLETTMKQTSTNSRLTVLLTNAFLFATVVFSTTGCIYIGNGNGDAKQSDRHHGKNHSHHTLTSSEKSQFALIDAYGKQPMPQDAAEGLNTMAANPKLSEAVQIHLIETTSNKLNSDNDRVTVYQTLAANKCLSQAATTHLITATNKLSMPNGRQSVLNAIAKHPNLHATATHTDPPTGNRTPSTTPQG